MKPEIMSDANCANDRELKPETASRKLAEFASPPSSSERQRTGAESGDITRDNAPASENSSAVPSPTALIPYGGSPSDDARCGNCCVGFYLNGICDHCGMDRAHMERLLAREGLEKLEIIFLMAARRVPLNLIEPALRNFALTQGWMRKAAHAEPFYVPAGELAELIGE